MSELNLRISQAIFLLLFADQRLGKVHGVLAPRVASTKTFSDFSSSAPPQHSRVAFTLGWMLLQHKEACVVHTQPRPLLIDMHEYTSTQINGLFVRLTAVDSDSYRDILLG